MTISAAMNNALTGLTATARMAEVVASNLSNVLTEGYARRVVDLSAHQFGGVRIDGITRVVDRGVLAERRLAEASLGFQSAMGSTLARLEAAIGVTDDPNGLSGRIAALEAAFSAAAADPANDLNLENVLFGLQAVAQTLNDDQAAIQDLRESADADIASQVDMLNAALKQVEVLNEDIAQARLTGIDPSPLMDQRQAAIDRISSIVPIRTVDRGSDRLALMTTDGEILLDGKAPVFGFTPVNTITPDMTLASGALSGLTRDGVPVTGSSGFGRLGGGSLGAAFKLRDETLPAAQAELDAIARDLIERFQDPAIDPTLGAGIAGLFTDGGAAFDPLNEVGIAGRIAVNASVAPDQGGLLSRIRDGAAATTPGAIGDASQIESWISAMNAQTVLSTGGTARTVAGHAIAFSGSISQQRVRTDDETAFATARYAAIYEAELSGGVDTDVEMQLLIQIEQAYAANARVIQTADAMIRSLLEI